MTDISCRVVALAVLLVVHQATLGWGQPATGSLSGLVTDPQGGVVPGAVVVALHLPTGTSTKA